MYKNIINYIHKYYFIIFTYIIEYILYVIDYHYTVSNKSLLYKF